MDIGDTDARTRPLTEVLRKAKQWHIENCIFTRGWRRGGGAYLEWPGRLSAT
jgi:hypothetical protein